MKSASTSGEPFRNPRADYQLPNTDSVWTFGANWRVNRWVKMIANAIHQSYEDPERTPVAGTADYWSGLVRWQVVF